MKTALLVINQDGKKLAERVKDTINSADLILLTAEKKESEKYDSTIDADSANRIILTEEKRKSKKPINKLLEDIFKRYEGMVFFAALGIVVRFISPLCKSKLADPAVVCVDSAGRFCISVLSGHEGGANQLVFDIAAILDAQPIITTGTEAHKTIILGIGCRRGISSDRIKTAIRQVLEENAVCLDQVRLVATIDLKKNEEGLWQACSEMGLPLVFIAKESIKNFKGAFSHSLVVKKYLGVSGVCEPCALIAGRRTQLLSKKKISNGVTIALAREN